MTAYPLALPPSSPALALALAPAPVEYAVAVEEYLSQAPISLASRRVYRISLTSWAWPLVGRKTPAGAQRRSAAAPVLPLALLDDASTGRRLAAAIAARSAATDARTVNRELSALRSAVAWWQDQQWISGDPTAGLQHLRAGPAAAPALTAEQVSRLFRLTASLREHAFWRVLYDTAARAGEILALDAGQLDLSRSRIRSRRGHDSGDHIEWQET